MKIKIKENAEQIYIRSLPARMPINWDWAHTMEAIQGETLEVETEWLFSDQFNTAPIKGVSDLGLRIMQNVVEEVIDDFRIGRQRCHWCGKHSEIAPVCPHCDKDGYLSPLIKPEPTKKFFSRC